MGDYIPPAPLFADLKAAKVYHARIHRPPGLKFSDTMVLLAAQTVLLVLYGLFVQQEKVPKQPYPDPGPADKPGMIDFVQPFKRYPPGFDNFFGSPRNEEFKLQEHYSSFMQISYFVFLSMPWSFSFLRKFSYSSSTFALFTACVSIQFGIIMMQIVDRIHCIFLEGLLVSPDFVNAHNDAHKNERSINWMLANAHRHKKEHSTARTHTISHTTLRIYTNDIARAVAHSIAHLTQ
jgi:hypothetical protein